MDAFRTHSPLFDDDVRALFDPHASLKRRNIDGGTGPDAIRKQIEKADFVLQKQRACQDESVLPAPEKY
jgi:argininosuccinate lyase